MTLVPNYNIIATISMQQEMRELQNVCQTLNGHWIQSHPHVSNVSETVGSIHLNCTIL